MEKLKRKKKINRNSEMIKKSILKIVVILIIVGLNWAGLSAIGETIAYFDDTENSSANTFSAGTLDFSLSAGDWQTPEKAVNLQPGESVTRDINVIKNGSLGFQYNASTVIDTENSDTGFCDALNLEAKLGTDTKYNDILSDLDFISPIVLSDGQDGWTFTITLSSSYTPPGEGAGCSFTFVFDAWQENLSVGQGFYDSEELDNSLETGGSTTSGYSPIADAYVDENSPGSNHGGAGELKVKSKDGGSSHENERTFIKFDFNFPSGTTILSSNLKLYMKLAPSISRTYEAWRVTDPWTEGGIKWNNKPAVAAISTDSISSGVTKNVWLPWDVTSDVRSFVSGTSNYGWQLKDSAENSSTAYEAKFHSRESNSITLRPILEVTFSSPEITTDHLVINEVYYHIGSGKGNDPKNEWVEIYNPTDGPIDISGWKICDKDVCDTIPTSSEIPSKGFAVITYKSSTWDKWSSIPPEAIKIVLNSAIGNGLANAGDRVILKDASNTEIDAMSYGNDTTYFELSVSGKGKSLARIVKGYDTNSATDWIINATPNPGTNPSVDGVETLIFTSYGVAVAGWEPVIEEDDSGEEEIFEEETVNEESVVEENTPEEINEEATTGENQTEENQEQGGIIEEINEIIDEVIDEIADEIMPDKEIGDEVVSEPEVQVIEDTLIIEEASGKEENNEEIIINEPTLNEPAIEEEPLVVPENPESDNSNPEEGGDASANEGSGDTIETPSE